MKQEDKHVDIMYRKHQAYSRYRKDITILDNLATGLVKSGKYHVLFRIYLV